MGHSQEDVTSLCIHAADRHLDVLLTHAMSSSIK